MPDISLTLTINSNPSSSPEVSEQLMIRLPNLACNKLIGTCENFFGNQLEELIKVAMLNYSVIITRKQAQESLQSGPQPVEVVSTPETASDATETRAAALDEALHE